jgi:hypothetical protein
MRNLRGKSPQLPLKSRAMDKVPAAFRSADFGQPFLPACKFYIRNAVSEAASESGVAGEIEQC